MDNLQTNYVSKIYGKTATNAVPYVYRITNIVTKMHYYGKRTANWVPPQDDLSIHYFSSSTDGEFLIDQRLNPQNYKYKVISTFQNYEDASKFECKLHTKFNVKDHPNFINKVNQTSSNFDSTGRGTAKCLVTGKSLGLISLDDPRWETGEIVGATFGERSNRASAKCPVTGEGLGSISLDDPRWETGEIVSFLKGINSGKSQAKCRITNKGLGLISLDDPRWETGEIVGATFGESQAKCPITGKRLGLISLDDPRWETGEIVGATFGESQAKCPVTGECLGSISLDDPRWKTGEIVGTNKSKALAKCSETEICIGYIPLDDPRWGTGEIVGYNKTFILITNGELTREYVADGSDTIPEGWYISLLPKKSKLIDIFDRYTNELLHSCVVPTLFCKHHKYDPSKLGKISRSNFNEPHSGSNPHHHNGVYARVAKALEQAVLLNSCPTN